MGEVSISVYPIDLQTASSAQVQKLGDVLRLARVGRKAPAAITPVDEVPVSETPDRLAARDSLARLEGIDKTLGARLVASGIWTLSDLADPARVEAAGKIEGVSAEAMRALHQAAKVALRYPALTPNETELAVKGFDLSVPLDRERVVELLSAPEAEIKTALARVKLPRSFGVPGARTLLKKLAEAEPV